MPNDNENMDALVSVIETLQKSIKRDYATIGSNETRTRNALIEPLLRALGWATLLCSLRSTKLGTDPDRPATVAVSTAGPAGISLAFIEAKRMREDLSDKHRRQAFGYARNRESVKYVGLTNGDLWEFYQIIGDQCRPILNVSIRDESASSCAAQLLQFSRGAEGFEDVEEPGDMEDYDTAEEVGRTLYDVLGVEPAASEEEIRRAYRGKMWQSHPDVSAHKNAHAEAKRTNEAYAVLSDAIKRSEYDRELAGLESAGHGSESDIWQSSPSPPSHYDGVSWEREAPQPYIEAAEAVHIGTILISSGVSAVGCFIIGYVIGFRTAEPVLDGFYGVVGVIALGFVILVAVLLILHQVLEDSL